jgi:hypothetical protein
MGRISDFRHGTEFDEFFKRLFAANHPNDFIVVNDSRGDKGVDGYIRSTQTFLSGYCPESHDEKTPEYIQDKIARELNKVRMLKESGRFPIRTFAFVTPINLDLESNEYLIRKTAAVLGVDGVSIGETSLTILFENTPSLFGLYPHLRSLHIEEKLDHIQDSLDEALEDGGSVFGADPIDTHWGYEPVSLQRQCDDARDAAEIPNILKDLHDDSDSVRLEAYKTARKHRNCEGWARITVELNKRWSAPDITPAERYEIVDLWSAASEFHRMPRLFEFWTKDSSNAHEKLSGILHGFMANAMVHNPDAVYRLVDEAITQRGLDGHPKHVAADLVSLTNKMLEQTEPKASAESRKLAKKSFPKLAPHRAQFPLINEIEKRLFPFR